MADQQRERGLEGQSRRRQRHDEARQGRLRRARSRRASRFENGAGHQSRGADRRGPRRLLLDVPVGHPLEERLPAGRDPHDGQGAHGRRPGHHADRTRDRGDRAGLRRGGVPRARREGQGRLPGVEGAVGGADDAEGHASSSSAGSTRLRAVALRLLVVGDIAWDIFIRPEGDLVRGSDVLGTVDVMPGGAAANVAVWARRLGADGHARRQDRRRHARHADARASAGRGCRPPRHHRARRPVDPRRHPRVRRRRALLRHRPHEGAAVRGRATCRRRCSTPPTPSSSTATTSSSRGRRRSSSPLLAEARRARHPDRCSTRRRSR